MSMFQFLLNEKKRCKGLDCNHHLYNDLVFAALHPGEPDLISGAVPYNFLRMSNDGWSGSYGHRSQFTLRQGTAAGVFEKEGAHSIWEILIFIGYYASGSANQFVSFQHIDMGDPGVRVYLNNTGSQSSGPVPNRVLFSMTWRAEGPGNCFILGYVDGNQKYVATSDRNFNYPEYRTIIDLGGYNSWACHAAFIWRRPFNSLEHLRLWHDVYDLLVKSRERVSYFPPLEEYGSGLLLAGKRNSLISPSIVV